MLIMRFGILLIGNTPFLVLGTCWYLLISYKLYVKPWYLAYQGFLYTYGNLALSAMKCY